MSCFSCVEAARESVNFQGKAPRFTLGWMSHRPRRRPRSPRHIPRRAFFFSALRICPFLHSASHSFFLFAAQIKIQKKQVFTNDLPASASLLRYSEIRTIENGSDTFFCFRSGSVSKSGSYDFFYRNGVPKWKGPGYYYSQFKPGLGVRNLFPAKPAYETSPSSELLEKPLGCSSSLTFPKTAFVIESLLAIELSLSRHPRCAHVQGRFSRRRLGNGEPIYHLLRRS